MSCPSILGTFHRRNFQDKSKQSQVNDSTDWAKRWHIWRESVWVSLSPWERNADVLRGSCVWHFEASSCAANLKCVRESHVLLLFTEFCSWGGALSGTRSGLRSERRAGRSRTPPGRFLTYVQVPNGGTYSIILQHFLTISFVTFLTEGSAACLVNHTLKQNSDKKALWFVVVAQWWLHG